MDNNKAPSWWPPRVLVLGPGGGRAFLEIGSLMCAEICNGLVHVDRVIGVSVGSIIGMLWLAGYSFLEIALECLDFSLLQNEKSLSDPTFWMELTKITERWGAFSHNHIQSRLELLLIAKFGFVPTLEQFALLTNKELTCVTVNLGNVREPISYINARTHPKLPVVTSILMSITIPGVFERIIVDGQLRVDGALRDPYPISYYDDGKTPILGLYIRNIGRFDLSADNGLAAALHFAFFAYGSSIEELYDRSVRTCSKYCGHLVLDTDVLDTTGITVSAIERIKMLTSGYVAMLNMIKEIT